MPKAILNFQFHHARSINPMEADDTGTYQRYWQLHILQKTVVTQKPLMVQPNAPRFMREGDNMEFTAKIVNLSEKEVTGIAHIGIIGCSHQ